MTKEEFIEKIKNEHLDFGIEQDIDFSMDGETIKAKDKKTQIGCFWIASARIENPYFGGIYIVDINKVIDFINRLESAIGIDFGLELPVKTVERKIETKAIDRESLAKLELFQEIFNKKKITIEN